MQIRKYLKISNIYEVTISVMKWKVERSYIYDVIITDVALVKNMKGVVKNIPRYEDVLKEITS